MGDSRTVRDIATMVQSHSPKFFLCETRQKASEMRRIRGRLGLQGFEGIDSNGLSGGLAMYWHESYQVTILGTDDRFIDLVVHLNATGDEWRLTDVYGEPQVENHHLMWSKLQNLRGSI